MAAGTVIPGRENRTAAAALLLRTSPGVKPEPELYLAMEHRRRRETRP